MTEQTPTYYGHAITPKLTKEQERQAIEMLAEGKSMRQITNELGVSYSRIRTLRDKRRTAENAAILQATKTTPLALNDLQNRLDKMTELLNSVVAFQASQSNWMARMNKALGRRQVENSNLRKTRKELIAEGRELKRFYHAKNGRKWQP